jgi:hypothetical protein
MADLSPHMGEGDILVEHQLCSKCEKVIELIDDVLFRKKPQTRQRASRKVDYYRTFNEVGQSAENGCHLCALLIGLCPSSRRQEGCEFGVIPCGVEFLEGQDHTGGRLSFSNPFMPWVNVALSYDAINDCRVRSTLFPSTRAPATYELLKTWLRECRKSHTECGNIK